VQFVSGETRKASFIGFTVTNAFDNVGTATTKVTGLGIYVENSSPTIEHNYIINNEFDEWYIAGGGIALINSSAKINNNKIVNNDYAYEGGGIYIEGGTDQIIESNFIANNYLVSGYGVCSGGGIYLRMAQRTIIQNNIFEENYLDFGNGSAIFVTNCDSIIIINNKCQNNRSIYWEGEVQIVLSSGKLINSLLHNSKYPNRTLLKFESSNFSVINTTIVNVSETAVRLINSNVQFINTIMHGINDSIIGKQIKLENSEAIFTNCDIEGDTTGFELIGSSSFVSQNTITADPLFIGSGAEPFSLSDNSPCINKGLNDTILLLLPLKDLAGATRVVGGNVDIGAYENQLIESLTTIQRTGNIVIFPNPANEWINIETNEGQKYEKIKVRIYSAEGVLVAEKELCDGDRIYIGNYKPGFYIAEINYMQEKFIGKFIKE